MRFDKALLNTGVTTLLAFTLLMSISESTEARRRDRDRQPRYQKNCSEFLTSKEISQLFAPQSNYQSRSYRGRNPRNQKYDQNQNRNFERRQRENQGYGNQHKFGDIRDSIYAELSQSHRHSISYSDARERIMHTLDMRQDRMGTYVWDYYCQRPFRLNPNQMPSSNDLNIEHTWPQSRFSTSFPRDQQKTDLHHLYPTDSWANQLRENMNFGYVQQDTRHTDANCKESRVGYDKNNQMRFQPPTHHRGSVARALFYFAIRYKLSIDAEQEAILRQWHKDDPVSAEDIERNNKIEEIQGNRNPFIDNPALVDDVPTFK